MRGSPDEMVLAQALANFTQQVAVPIIWHDAASGWPRTVYGATCFFVRFPHGIIGITADHVIGALQLAMIKNPNIICQLRTSKAVDLLDLVVDRCPQWDIATFRISEELLDAIGGIAVDCTSDWPPPEPAKGRAVTFCGFPEAERVVLEPAALSIFACGSLTVIEAVTERDIILTYDPSQDEPAPWAPWAQPLGYNMSGCSGGPVLSHGTRNGLQRSFLVGMVVAGPRGTGTGEAEGFDILRMRRIYAVEPDGMIRRTNSGWLPR